MTCLSATLTEPLLGRIQSRYGMRIGITTGQPSYHGGYDIRGPEHAMIYAAEGGEVAFVASESAHIRSPLGGFGNVVVIAHDDGRTWALYAHLHEAFPAVGQRIRAGEPIGLQGRTTNGRYPRMVDHLHFELRRPMGDGSMPFPAAYGRYDIDPGPWFAERGLGFSAQAGLTFDPSKSACASPVGPPAALHGLRGVRKLGGPTPARPPAGPTLGPSDLNAGYEPPMPDPEFFKGTPIWLSAAGAALAAGVGLTALFFAPRAP